MVDVRPENVYMSLVSLGIPECVFINESMQLLLLVWLELFASRNILKSPEDVREFCLYFRLQLCPLGGDCPPPPTLFPVDAGYTWPLYNDGLALVAVSRTEDAESASCAGVSNCYDLPVQPRGAFHTRAWRVNTRSFLL